MTVIRCAVLATFCLSCCGNIFAAQYYQAPSQNNGTIASKIANIEKLKVLIGSQLPNLDQLEMKVMDAKTALLEAKVKRGNIKRAEFNLANAQQTYEREKRKYNDLMEQLDQLEIERVQLSNKYN